MSSSPPPSSPSAMAARAPSRGCSLQAAPALPFAGSAEGPTSGSLAGAGPASASALRRVSASSASVLAMQNTRPRLCHPAVGCCKLPSAWQSWVSCCCKAQASRFSMKAQVFGMPGVALSPYSHLWLLQSNRRHWEGERLAGMHGTGKPFQTHQPLVGRGLLSPLQHACMLLGLLTGPDWGSIWPGLAT